MFENTYKLDFKQKDSYRMSLPIDEGWAKRPQRVLVVLETVDSEDLKEGRLLHNRSRVVLENLLRFSVSRAKLHGYKRSSTAFAAINFNNVKFMDKPRDTWGSYKTNFKNRLLQAIKQLEPTHLLILGDHAANSVLTDFGIDYVEKKRGWVYDITFGKLPVKVCTSLDLHPLYSPKKEESMSEEDWLSDDDDIGKDVHAKSNLLFYVSEHVVNCLMGKLLFDLSSLKPKPVYVDTIEKFNKLWNKLKTEEVIAIDTETRNGSVNHNAIHTIQFAFSSSVGYVLPYRHPDTPFSKNEIAYMRKRLRKLLLTKPGKDSPFALKYIITQYGMFDLRIMRVEFGIPVIRVPVWEITAGEYCFDPSTVVQTEQGGMKIEDLVATSSPPRVLSFNHETGHQEYKAVVRSSKHTTTQKMLEIEYEGGTLRVTEDHKLWCVNRQAYVCAKDLTPDDELLLR